MMISVVVRDVPDALRPAIDALLVGLKAHPSFAVNVVESLGDSSAADAYLLCGHDNETIEREVSDFAARLPDALDRILVLGAAHGFVRGSPDAEPGTVAALLETYRLGGCFAPEALTAWREAPSWFAGPKDMMAAFGSNAFKAFQSENYALWFAAPGATMVDFLASYVRALASRRVSAGLDGGTAG